MTTLEEPPATPPAREKDPPQSNPPVSSVDKFEGNSFTGNNSGSVYSTTNHYYPAMDGDNEKQVKVEEAKTGLVDGPVSDLMVEQAVRAFCFPHGYAKAAKILRERRIVLLSGRSTGRSLTGVRLFVDLDLTKLQRLDPARSLKDIFTMKMPKIATGYLWDDIRSGTWSEDLHERMLEQLEDVLRQHHSYLIVATTSDDVRRESAGPYLAELVAPATGAVAQEHLKYLGVSPERRHELLDRIALDKVLPGHSRPSRGAKLAKVLYDVDQGSFELNEAMESLYDYEDGDIKAWFEKYTDVSTRALAISIAVLEECPYIKIASAAKKLEDVLSNPDNQDLWPYDAPDLFAETRTDRLRHAMARIRINSSVNQIDPEKVVFTRPDWGSRLLHYVWKEHDRIRPILHQWVGDVGSTDLPSWATGHEKSMIKFGTLLATSAEPEPMEWIRLWAYDKSRDKQSIAAMALGGLCANSNYVHMIKNYLYSWCNPRTRLDCRTTAVKTLGGPLGRGHPEFALGQIRRLIRNSADELRVPIIKAVRALMTEPSNRTLVLSTLPVWLAEGGATSRVLALTCAVDALALNAQQGPIAFLETEAIPVRVLFTALLEDHKLRKKVLSGLVRWGQIAEMNATLRPHVLDLLKLLFTSPDDVLVRRLSFYLRKVITEDQAATKPLAVGLSQVLKEISHEN